MKPEDRYPKARPEEADFVETSVRVTPRFEEIARIVDVMARKLWPL
jgi:hypothetical protein